MVSDAHVDKGWAWIVCFGCFIVMFLETGIVKALGVLLPVLRQQFESETWIIGLVISLVPGIGAIMCPLAGALCKHFTARPTVIFFGLLASLGLITGSLATSVPMLLLSFVLTGLSVGAEAILIAQLAIYFLKRYDIAIAVGHVGMAAGIFVIPPLTQTFIDAYGWRGTMLLLGGINMHIALSGAFLRPVTSSLKENLTNETSAIPQQQQHVRNNPKSSIFAHIIDYLDLSLFREAAFLSLFVSFFGTNYSFSGWVIYLVPFAVDIGLPYFKSTFLASLGGIGSIFGFTLFPLFSRRFSSHKLLISFTFISSLALLMYPLFSAFDSYIGLTFASVLYGSARSVATLNNYQIIKEDMVGDQATSAIPLIFVSTGVGCILSGFFSGWIYDQTGSFTVSFVVLSVISFLSVCPQGILMTRPTRTSNPMEYSAVSSNGSASVK